MIGSKGIMIENIQYIYDCTGHKTAVIVPIDIWEKVLTPCDKQSRCDISQYYGVYREFIAHPDKLAASLRDEWDRE
ncbi:MAG: hypothetical protein BWY45_02593 [Euryarchaeota archaeon ADurb.Bin294]|jgi:hypothetical protein|nr:hypothetical protein [Methanomicrobiales archaeon]OQA54411.1 MAG: hypothetical protein BWY45_02593 [Euryarchaeota archaeon ADurb.Bin294]